MNQDNFKPDMTYWQSLRIVFRGLIQNPYREGDFEDLCAHLRGIGWIVLGWIARFALMVLLPISAPLFTLLVQANRKLIAERREAARKKIIDRYVPNHSASTQEQQQSEGSAK